MNQRKKTNLTENFFNLNSDKSSAVLLILMTTKIRFVLTDNEIPFGHNVTDVISGYILNLIKIGIFCL